MNRPSGGARLSHLLTLRPYLSSHGLPLRYYGPPLGGPDASQIYTDIANNALPAVSIVHPQGVGDGHPGFSTLSKYEDFATTLANTIISNGSLFSNTAIVFTFDEGGAYYDTHYVQ